MDAGRKKAKLEVRKMLAGLLKKALLPKRCHRPTDQAGTVADNHKKTPHTWRGVFLWDKVST
jgi:hypothetical protein